jgi:hypothetical protein
MNIEISNGNIIVTIPLTQSDTHTLDENLTWEQPNLIGVREGADENDPMYLAHAVYLDYKDDLQVGAPLVYIYDLNEFNRICNDANIPTVVYEKCSKCTEVLYGSYIWSSDGPICFLCNRDIESANVPRQAS